MAIVTRFI